MNNKKHPYSEHFKATKTAEIYKFEDDTLKKVGRTFPADKVFDGVRVKFLIGGIPKTAIQLGLKKGFYLNPSDVALTEKDGKVIHTFTNEKKVAERMENSSPNKVLNFDSPALKYQNYHEYLGVDANDMKADEAALLQSAQADAKTICIPTYMAVLPLVGVMGGLFAGLRAKGGAMQTFGYVATGFLAGFAPVLIYSAIELHKIKNISAEKK
jgi:hypothetical protein